MYGLLQRPFLMVCHPEHSQSLKRSLSMYPQDRPGVKKEKIYEPVASSFGKIYQSLT
jgi:hypothetical protein